MKNAYLSIGLLVASAFASSTASAAIYYVSDCATGAVSTCQAGSDSNAGTSPTAPWKSISKVYSTFPNLNAGDTIRFAKGGAWANAAMPQLQNLKATASSPITFEAYSPSWYTGSNKPILAETRSGGGLSLLGFDDGGSPEADGGYVVRGLYLQGNGVVDRGIFTSQQTSNITLDDLVIDGFKLGLYCGTGIQNVKLTNSTLKNNPAQGILTECANSLIENNTFDNNGFEQAVYDHTIYVNSGDSGTKNLIIRNNTLRNNTMIDGKCQSVPLVAHGVIDGLVIENNKIIQAAGTGGEGCWGIAVDGGYGEAESFKNVTIRGNTLVNVGGVGIGCSSCINPVIENNVIVMDAGPVLVGISVPDRSRGGGDAADTGATIRNNSIYFTKATSESWGISFISQNGATAGSNVTVVSNLIYFGAGSSQYHECFATTGMTLANFKAFDYNLCYHAGGTGNYSLAYKTLADAKAAGFDKNGLSVDPKLVAAPTSGNNYSMALSAGSPAINAGHPTLSATLDRLLSLTRSTPDIGAFEFSAAGADTTPPASPSSVIVQ